MSFQKIRTIKVSERVFDIVCEALDFYQVERGKKIDGWLSTFNNCREQGFYLTIESTDFENENRTKKDMFVWACECRNSDEIMVVISYTYPINKGMFDDEAYEKARYFKYNELQQSADYILKEIKEHFSHEIG